jgi:hypothetical protein
MIAIVGLIVSSFAIFMKILTPITVQIIIEGNIVELTEIPNIYTAWDMVITSISCAILGSSLIYLIVEDKIQQPHLPPSIQDNWNNIVENLTNTDEKAIVTLIIAEGGTMFQSQLVEKSGFSKTKVSLVLDRLEARNVLERRRHGMSNVIVLKSATK